MNKKLVIFSAIFAGLIILLMVFAAVFHFVVYRVMSDETRMSLIRGNSFVKDVLLPVFRKARKVGDVVYFPYYFKKSELPNYELYIEPKNIKKLDDSLPGGMFCDPLHTNKVFVKAKFKYQNKEYNVEVRYRGDHSIHWESEKKSYLIKFEDGELFDGMRRISFIIVDDRRFIVEQLNNYRADKLGLLRPESHFGTLRINGKNNGLYFIIENWSQEMLAKWGVPDDANFYGGVDSVERFGVDTLGKNLWQNLGSWNKLVDNTGLEYSHSSDLDKLSDLINNSSDEEFYSSIFNLIDEDNFLNWLAHQNLVGSIHQASGNLRLYFNDAVGKFFFVPWDVTNFQIPETINEVYSKLVMRVLSNPDYMYERNHRLWQYISNEANLIDDLNYYDEVYRQIKPALYQDRMKVYTNRWADNLIEQMRAMFIGNIEKLKEIFGEHRAFVEVRTNLIEDYTIFDIKVDNVSELSFDNISTPDFDIYYDSNRNDIFDWNDELLEGPNFGTLLFTKRDIPETISEPWQIKLTKHRFFLLGKTNWSDVKFDISNAVTGVKLEDEDIVISIVDESIFTDFEKISRNINEFLAAHPYFSVDLAKKELILNGGVYYIGKTVIIPKDFSLRIEPSAVLNFRAGTSIIVYNSVKAEGTKWQPITFTAQDSSQPWGVFAVVNSANKSYFKNCIFEYGSEEYINGAYITGMLAVHYADVDIEDSVFRYANGDDGLNVKSGQAKILRNTFNDNKFDALDVDWVEESLIEDNNFSNNGNDSIDVGGGSNILIKNNQINKSGDKCVSIGEQAKDVTVFNNLLKECLMGVAIKDSSETNIVNNLLINNKTAVGVYEKKPVFGGADAKIYNSIIWGSETVASIDGKSSLEIEFSDVQGGYDGEGNVDIEPEFDSSYRLMNQEPELLLESGVPMGKIFDF